MEPARKKPRVFSWGPLSTVCNNLPELQRLVRVGYSVHAVSSGGQSLASRACELEDGLPAVRWMMEKQGVDFSIKDRLGNTPLDSAIVFDHRDIVTYLASKGVRPAKGWMAWLGLHNRARMGLLLCKLGWVDEDMPGVLACAKPEFLRRVFEVEAVVEGGDYRLERIPKAYAAARAWLRCFYRRRWGLDKNVGGVIARLIIREAVLESAWD